MPLSNLHLPTDDLSTTSFVVRSDVAIPSIVASVGLSPNQISSSAAFETLSIVSATTFGHCVVMVNEEIPQPLSQLVGFTAQHAIVSDLVDANGDRVATFISVGKEQNPSDDHLGACQQYVDQVESSFDADMQRLFAHLTSMELQSRENTWQRRVSDLRTKNNELDRMASYAAHEFKTPLRSVTFDAEYMVTQLGEAIENGTTLHGDERGETVSISVDLLSEISVIAQTIYNQSAQLSRQLDDLLVVARSDGESPPMEPVDVAGLVNGMLDRHRHDIAAVGASVDLGAMPTIWSNAQSMAIVVSNLISNAIRFRSPYRTLHITVSSEPCDAGVLLSISDNGIGIDEEHHDRIFGSFHRLHESEEGLGLGLSLCTRLLEPLEATLEVTSGLDQGTRFTIRLPQP